MGVAANLTCKVILASAILGFVITVIRRVLDSPGANVVKEGVKEILRSSGRGLIAEGLTKRGEVPLLKTTHLYDASPPPAILRVYVSTSKTF